jgi:hypothetical protein
LQRRLGIGLRGRRRRIAGILASLVHIFHGIQNVGIFLAHKKSLIQPLPHS